VREFESYFDSVSQITRGAGLAAGLKRFPLRDARRFERANQNPFQKSALIDDNSRLCKRS